VIGVCDARGVQADPRWSRFRAIGIPESDAVCDAVIGRCESPVDIDRAVLRQAVTDAAWARLAELTEGRIDVTAHSLSQVRTAPNFDHRMLAAYLTTHGAVGLALADKLRSYLVYVVPQQYADRVCNGEFRCPDSDIAD